MNEIYNKVKEFKNKYPFTIAWRLKKHCKVAAIHLNPDETVRYVFCGQKNDTFSYVFTSCVLVLTNKRLLIAQKRVLFGYTITSITPDLYNDLEVFSSLFFGKIIIDTVKENVVITNLSKKCLPEVETEISSFMMEEKRHYKINNEG